nr:YciI family protein [Pseudodesulfovibrio tunisiensis]
MFVVILEYTDSLERIDALLDEHVAYLREQYAAGMFLASGRQEPRVGGVILAAAESREALDKVLARDPFQRENVAKYQVVEFHPGMTAQGVEQLWEV